LRRDGQLFFGSYRDPNLKETLDVFDGTAEVVRHFEATDREMLKSIIGTMSGVDMPLTPRMKGDAAAECYLRGITYEDRQQSRDEILSTRQEDIRARSRRLSTLACTRMPSVSSVRRRK
jgi:presequence protease